MALAARHLGLWMTVAWALSCGRAVQDPDAAANAGRGGDRASAGSNNGGEQGGMFGSGGASVAGKGAAGGTDGSVLGGSAGSSGKNGDECVLGVRLDRCCLVPQPVTRASIEGDPCWVPWPVSEGEVAASGCPPIVCNGMCPETVTVQSRVIEPDPAGGCRFASECKTADDCTIVRDASRCCRCPEAFPKSLVESSSCLIAPDVSEPPSCATCAEVPCDDGCPAIGSLSCLLSRDGLTHCASAAPVALAPDQCAAEQACPASSTGCIVCLQHGDQACGGPLPRPSDCSSDAECKAGGDNLICATAPCQNAHCIAGCLSAEDCEPSHDCTDNHCLPRACSADSDCSANFLCRAGKCARKECLSSLTCDGFCVLNVCQELAGNCVFGCRP